MTSQYSHLHFYRRVPSPLLQRYFISRNVVLDVDLEKLKPSEVEPILDAFLRLDSTQQAEIEAEFQDIHALSCEGGVAALVDEAAFHGDEVFTDELAQQEGFHAKVMWAFLEKPLYWRGATMFLHADNVSPSYWKKRNDLPRLPPNVEDADIETLATSISGLFTKEGRGKNCKVEPYRRHGREYFFAYPEDFAQLGVEWVSNTLKTLAHHPAFEIIFVYCEAEGSLDIFAPRNSKAVPELQKAFAKAILKLDTLADGSIDKRVYDLALLQDANFSFTTSPELGIASVEVKRMRLTLKRDNKKRITLEADTTNNPKAVYELRDSLNLPPHFITQLGIKVTFVPEGGKRAKTRTFNITYPNSCALNNDGLDLKIRNMLAASGIEPRLEDVA
ncbi:MAG: hypothetical protein CMK46_04190 [Porticoccus sp.]|uniref:hypothetical protein n=1 Tax=Porticoccus hydrocarbonoclasticus TaxID=1073414 RepID=UPI000C438B0E|nr:hypothetical protein [Porticoccus hydrocarbonoclasticus]MBG57471.1 hypothetical protein [Porticoccus sp.]|tara:strand:- start:1921 stop:3087 length:1167 start_codon:yes stop_codon:yes gene_type:complete